MAIIEHINKQSNPNLSDKKSLCEQIETLGQFQKVCDMIGLYNLNYFSPK